MARKVRVQCPRAIYHVMNHCDHAEAVFRDRQDSDLFLTTLGKASAITDWQVHSYCLMSKAQSWLAAHSINKNLLQLIRLRPVAGLGLVHDRNASEVSEPSTTNKPGPRTQLQSYFCRLASIRIQLISSFFKGFQAISKQKNDLVTKLAKPHHPTRHSDFLLTGLARETIGADRNT
jgi:hypothetical protein